MSVSEQPTIGMAPHTWTRSYDKTYVINAFVEVKYGQKKPSFGANTNRELRIPFQTKKGTTKTESYSLGWSWLWGDTVVADANGELRAWSWSFFSFTFSWQSRFLESSRIISQYHNLHEMFSNLRPSCRDSLHFVNTWEVDKHVYNDTRNEKHTSPKTW